MNNEFEDVHRRSDEAYGLYSYVSQYRQSILVADFELIGLMDYAYVRILTL